jgi:hypothetical protein
MVSSYSTKNLFKQQTLKEPKLVQLDSVLYKWFIAMYSKGKAMTVLVVIEKAKPFNDAIKILQVHIL